MTTTPARRRATYWPTRTRITVPPRRAAEGLVSARDDGTWEWTCLLCASATGYALGLADADRALSGHLLTAHGEVTA